MRGGDAEDGSSEISAPADTPDDTERHAGPPLAHPPGQPDVVEKALADALRPAAEAGAFDAVAALTAELRARREARAGAVSLEAERAKRGGKR
jgi:hypothetical protein